MYQRKAILLDQVSCSIVVLDNGIKLCFQFSGLAHTLQDIEGASVAESLYNALHTIVSALVLVPFLPSALAAHSAQRSGFGVRDFLQETRGGGGLADTHGEETLVCGEEHPHLRALRDQDPSQEQSGPGPRAKDSVRILGRGL